MRNRLPSYSTSPASWLKGVLLLLSIPAALQAQTEIGTQIGTEGSGPANASLLENLAKDEQAFRNESSPTVIVSPPTAPLNYGDTPFQWGFLSARPSVNYRFTYGNIQRGSDKSIQQSVTPGLLLGLGNHWAINYAPSLSFYSDEQFRNSVNHSASLRGEMVLGDWSLKLSQLFSTSSDILIETASQTDQKHYVTSLGAGYNFNNGFSLDLAAHQRIQDAPGISSSRSWSTRDGINYQFSSQFSAGLAVGFGYTDVDDPNSDWMHEEFRVRLRWTPGQKLSAEVSGGIDVRQFMDSDGDNEVSPAINASIRYSPIEATSLSLNANQSLSTSTVGSLTENTDLTFGIRQRFFQKLYLNVSPGYRVTEYETGPSGGTNRSDDYFFVSTSLSVNIFKRGHVSVFYNYSENDSNLDFGYVSTQVGFTLGYRF